MPAGLVTGANQFGSRFVAAKLNLNMDNGFSNATESTGILEFYEQKPPNISIQQHNQSYF